MMISCLLLFITLLSYTRTHLKFELSEKWAISFDQFMPKAGQKLIVRCSVVGLLENHHPCVSWRLKRQYDGQTIFLATNDKVYQFLKPVQRLFAIHEFNSKDWFLKFNPLDRNDLGNISCHICDTDDEEISVTRFLNVHSSPIILDSSSKDMSVNEGDTIQMHCFAQGYPTPLIEWMRADGRILPGFNVSRIEGSILKLENVTKFHRGIYKCGASNLIGEASKRTLYLSVRFPPYIECYTTAVGQASNVLIDTYLECYVFGHPSPDVRWFYARFDGFKLISNDYKHYIESIVPEIEFCTECILSRLSIMNVETNDYGVYWIQASSDGFPAPVNKSIRLFETTECQNVVSFPSNSRCRPSF